MKFVEHRFAPRKPQGSSQRESVAKTESDWPVQSAPICTQNANRQTASQIGAASPNLRALGLACEGLKRVISYYVCTIQNALPCTTMHTKLFEVVR